MTPVDQTRFLGESGPPGNCYAACIASILDLPLSAVPDEAEFWKPGMSDRESWRLFMPHMEEFLRSKGLCLVEVPQKHVFYQGRVFDPHLVISGPSPRDPKVNLTRSLARAALSFTTHIRRVLVWPQANGGTSS